MKDEYIKAIRNDLILLSDENYKLFHSKLIPTVSSDSLLGVRTPVLRSYADKVYKAGKYGIFFKSLPHKYYEENNLHSFIICKIKDYDTCINELEKFLPFIDNWAVCDSLRPICFKDNKDRLIIKIFEWIKRDEPYTVRFAIEMLMCHFLDEEFDERYLSVVSQIKSSEYYVNMMIAWYFATALAKQYDETILYFTENRLPQWVHNKAIQKAVESCRISTSVKIILKELKIKK